MPRKRKTPVRLPRYLREAPVRCAVCGSNVVDIPRHLAEVGHRDADDNTITLEVYEKRFPAWPMNMPDVLKRCRLRRPDWELLGNLILRFHQPDEIAFCLDQMKHVAAEMDDMVEDDWRIYREVTATQLRLIQLDRRLSRVTPSGDVEVAANDKVLGQMVRMRKEMREMLDSLGMTRAQREKRELTTPIEVTLPALLEAAEDIVSNSPEAFTFKCGACGNFGQLMFPVGSPCPHCGEIISPVTTDFWALKGDRGEPWNDTIIAWVLAEKLTLAEAAEVLETSMEQLVLQAKRRLGSTIGERLENIMNRLDPPLMQAIQGTA